MTVTGWGWLLVSCSRWWCRFDDDDNVREMIVRAMTSESGEMCNLEDVQEIEFKEDIQRWANTPPTSSHAERSWGATGNRWRSRQQQYRTQELRQRPEGTCCTTRRVHRCMTEVQERQSAEVANESEWPIHKTQGCRYNWVVEEPPSPRGPRVVWHLRQWLFLEALQFPMLPPEKLHESQGAKPSCKMNPFAGYISETLEATRCVAGAFMARLRGRGRRTFFLWQQWVPGDAPMLEIYIKLKE